RQLASRHGATPRQAKCGPEPRWARTGEILVMDKGNNRTENRPWVGSDDYLWDRSGEPDPEIQHLEALLERFRHDSPTPAFPEIVPERRWGFFPWRLRLFPALATAAVGVAAIVAVTFLVYGTKPTPTTVAGLNVSSVEGTPRIGRKTISGKEGTGLLGIGQMLETDGLSRASLQADDTGKID